MLHIKKRLEDEIKTLDYELKVTLPPPVRNPDWPQVGGSPSHAMQHLEAAETIAPAWRAGIGAGSGGGSVILAPPIVAGGRVFAVDADGELSAHDAATGDNAWRFTPEDVDDAHGPIRGARVFCFAHVLVGKPVSTFPGHALKKA